ncbi:hypothetical protein Hanom_Chr12g01109511 [Helianthus anomalus]
MAQTLKSNPSSLLLIPNTTHKKNHPPPNICNIIKAQSANGDHLQQRTSIKTPQQKQPTTQSPPIGKFQLLCWVNESSRACLSLNIYRAQA